MWHSDDFKAYLNKKVGASDDIWKHKIQSRMKTIVASSLQCVQDMVTQRKNTCELYGYDFMLDENYDVSECFFPLTCVSTYFSHG